MKPTNQELIQKPHLYPKQVQDGVQQQIDLDADVIMAKDKTIKLSELLPHRWDEGL